MEQNEKLAEIRFISHADQLRQVRGTVRDVLQQQDYAPEIIDHLVLAVDEACTNVIKHAYGQGCAGQIILEILRQQGKIVFRLTDFADPVDKCTIQPRDLDELRPGGLGVHLIREIMDEVEFLDTPEGIGNILEMRKRITLK